MIIENRKHCSMRNEWFTDLFDWQLTLSTVRWVCFEWHRSMERMSWPSYKTCCATCCREYRDCRSCRRRHNCHSKVAWQFLWLASHWPEKEKQAKESEIYRCGPTPSGVRGGAGPSTQQAYSNSPTNIVTSSRSLPHGVHSNAEELSNN